MGLWSNFSRPYWFERGERMKLVLAFVNPEKLWELMKRLF